MANSNAVSSTLPSNDNHCKICDLHLDSVESFNVHREYHKENLYVKWSAQNSHNDMENNNGAKVKNDTTVSAPADSSDNMITKPSPEFQQRATPETSAQFPHPATPQSYHSAPSPYQNPDQTNFSPNTQFNNSYPHSGFQQNQHSEQINWEQTQYNQEYHKPTRFHPYNMQERVSQVSSSSPLYGQPLNQPTPSPSPNQCDKCGFVCDSAVQLNEHCNSAHAGANATAATASLPFTQFPGKQYSNSSYPNDASKIKEEHEESSDILDLDSQKVVYQGNEGEQQNAHYEQSPSQGRDVNARTVPMMPWETQKLYSNPQINGEVSLFKEQKIFSEQKSYQAEAKMFHPDQKFTYNQDKFLAVHHEQKPFMHVEQKIYSSVQMPPLSEYAGPVAPTNPDMKPPYRPYDSSTAPQISSTQPSNPTSSALPTIGKGANWKSNEARRPKTYNCTACNKWFTSSGHLKRHYNTTLHKNAVRSSGQPDPATMPISSHHHPSRDSLQQRAQQQSADSNTQSPVPSEDSRGVDDPALQSYASQNFDRSHRVTAMQSKSPYSHLQQGNLDNNFSNNPLANHPLQHQVGSHPLNIGTQPPGIGIPNDNTLQGSKNVAITTAGNPPNGEAGPSASQNHHMRGLLSVSTSNITTPVLTQSTPALSGHTLPPFSHLAVNQSYNPRSTDPLGPSVPDPTHTPLYLGQNFQQTIAPSYPNGMAPHVTDMAINNLPIANPATFGEFTPDVVQVMEHESSNQPAGGRLPSFAHLQTQRFGVYVPNYIASPNVGGTAVADETTTGYIIVDPIHSQLQFNNIEIGGQSVNYDFNFTPRTIKENVVSYNSEQLKSYTYSYALGGKAIKRDDDTNSTELQILKMEDIMDYANKENHGLPASPESAKVDNDSRGSPSISTTVPSTPLSERNQLTKTAPASVHKCYECDKLFNKACYLTQHNKTFHSGVKPFKCVQCGKRFSDCVTYEEHCHKHTDNKPFKCGECPKSFNHKTDLRRHMCHHSGCKPFACDQCGKSFIRKDHMIKHVDTHIKKNLRSSSASNTSPMSS